MAFSSVRFPSSDFVATTAALEFYGAAHVSRRRRRCSPIAPLWGRKEVEKIGKKCTPRAWSRSWR